MDRVEKEFILLVGEPWDFEGPDGPNRIHVILNAEVAGPAVENWSASYLLFEVRAPFTFEGRLYTHLLAAPRYASDTLEAIREDGGVVGVAGLHVDPSVLEQRPLSTDDATYIVVASLEPVGEGA